MEGEEGGEKKHPRTQMRQVLGISASPARCATVIKAVLTTPEAEAQQTVLREKMKAAAAAAEAAEKGGDAPGAAAKKEEAAAAKKELAELAEQQVRLSSQTPISMAVVVDGVIKSLLTHAMGDAAKGATRKMVNVANFHSAGVEELACYPLFANCKTWKEYSEEKEGELEAARTAQNKQVKLEREAAKKAAAETGAAVVKAPKAPAPAAEGEEEGKVSFATYVDNALHDVKETAEFAAMRVSGRVKDYVSDLIFEVVQRLATLSHLVVTQMVAVKTMTTEHVMSVVTFLMTDAGKGAEEIEKVLEPVKKALQCNQEHRQAETAAKVAKQTPEKLAEIKAKKEEQDRQRMQRQAAQTRARAIAFAQKAKDLQEACAAAGVHAPHAPASA